MRNIYTFRTIQPRVCGHTWRMIDLSHCWMACHCSFKPTLGRNQRSYVIDVIRYWEKRRHVTQLVKWWHCMCAGTGLSDLRVAEVAVDGSTSKTWCRNVVQDAFFVPRIAALGHHVKDSHSFPASSGIAHCFAQVSSFSTKFTMSSGSISGNAASVIRINPLVWTPKQVRKKNQSNFPKHSAKHWLIVKSINQSINQSMEIQQKKWIVWNFES